MGRRNYTCGPHSDRGSTPKLAEPPTLAWEVRTSCITRDVVEEGRRPDERELSAVERLRQFLDAHRERVFYSRQLEVLFEDDWFHWITNRAVRDLEVEGLLRSEERELRSGGTVKLLWHRGNRYPRRAASRIAGLVEEYSADHVSEAVGERAEQLLLAGLASRQFVFLGRASATYGEVVWGESGHDLDFIVEKDGIGYGIEVKNRLGYMGHDELEVKTELCLALGLRPVFVVRMNPRSWIEEVRKQGGFTLVMKYQLYPPLLRDLVARMRVELTLPVDHPRSLASGTMDRLVRWHEGLRP
jgi:hypothetical protein